YYDFWLYHFASVRGFAGGYYDRALNEKLARTQQFYGERTFTQGGYLLAGVTPAQVDHWFDPDARLVVVLTFDTEGLPDQIVAETCAVTDVLRAHRVPGTFFVVAAMAELVDANPVWHACLDGFEIANHTYRHPGRREMMPRGLFATYPHD